MANPELSSQLSDSEIQVLGGLGAAWGGLYRCWSEGRMIYLHVSHVQAANISERGAPVTTAQQLPLLKSHRHPAKQVLSIPLFIGKETEAQRGEVTC